MNEHAAPEQQPLFQESVTFDVLFPGYRDWLARRKAFEASLAHVHPLERGLYETWCNAVSGESTEQKENEHGR